MVLSKILIFKLYFFLKNKFKEESQLDFIVLGYKNHRIMSVMKASDLFQLISALMLYSNLKGLI